MEKNADKIDRKRPGLAERISHKIPHRELPFQLQKDIWNCDEAAGPDYLHTSLSEDYPQ